MEITQVCIISIVGIVALYVVAVYYKIFVAIVLVKRLVRAKKKEQLILTIILLYNYICRVVKASSPWLNVILLLGIIIWLPAALLNSLAVSSIEYGIAKEHSDALCRVS